MSPNEGWSTPPQLILVAPGHALYISRFHIIRIDDNGPDVSRRVTGRAFTISQTVHYVQSHGIIGLQRTLDVFQKSARHNPDLGFLILP